MLSFRYVSLLRQRSSTTTSATTPDDRPDETTMNVNFEEPREKTTKVSDEVITTESSIINTDSFNTEPFTDITTKTVNADKSSEATQMLTSITEKMSETTSTARIRTSSVAKNNGENMSTTNAPTSTITNVITSIYEAATERTRVRVKNIENFLLEHKKNEPATRSTTPAGTASATVSSMTMENMIEEPTQKSILKGRFRGQVQFRPTLRKPIGLFEKSATTTTTTEKTIETTTDRRKDEPPSTEKKGRLIKYVNRFSRPAANDNTESTSTTGKRFGRPTTESTLESSTRQFNRFRSTTSASSTDSTDNGSTLARRSYSRVRPAATTTTTELPLTSSTELQKSRFFRSRRPVASSSTSTTTAAAAESSTPVKELLKTEENAENVRYETTTFVVPTTTFYPTTIVEETSTNDDEFRVTMMTVDGGFESVKNAGNEVTTTEQQPTTTTTDKTIGKTFRGSVRANNNAVPDDNVGDKSSRSPSSARQNSRFLKDEQKLFFIRILPSPDGRSQNEFTSPVVKNVTRNRGRVRAFDSLELSTLSPDGLTGNERSKELFRGSETNFRVRQSTTTTNPPTESSEEV